MRGLQRNMLAVTAFLALASGSQAQTPSSEAQQPYEPTVGQAGKDSVWVPTPPSLVEKMLDHASVTADDFVMDLGSGDGRNIIAAARRGARGLGIEYNPDLVEYSKRQAAAAGVSDKAMFAQGDMYEADISKATVLALFLLPTNLEKLAPKFMELPPGTRIVVNTFWVPGWAPDDTIKVEDDCESWCTSHLIIVPARVQGEWRVGDGVLALTQTYQQIEGTYTAVGGTPEAVKGSLRGTDVTMAIGGTEYRGAVNGGTMELAASSNGGARTLVATRAAQQ
jgi:hypothetical protein